MNRTELASFLCKLLALYTVLSTLGSSGIYLVSLLSTVAQPSMNASGIPPTGLLLFSVLALLLPFIAAVLLWIYADKVAPHMGGASHHTSKQTSWNKTQLIELFLNLLGLYLVIIALPHLAQLLAQLFVPQPPFIIQQNILSQFIAVVIQLILGFLLVRRPEKFSSLLQKPHKT